MRGLEGQASSRLRLFGGFIGSPRTSTPTGTRKFQNFTKREDTILPYRGWRFILSFDLLIVFFFRPVDCFFPSKEREPSTSRKTSPPASLYKTTRRRSLMPSGEEFPLPIPPRRIQASGTKGDFQGGIPLKTFSSPFFVVSQRMAPTFLLKKKSRQKKTKSGRNNPMLSLKNF